jgi:hypothetical protein
MGYAQQESVEAGIRFKTPSGVMVKTTGKTTHVQSVAQPQGLYVHQVEIVEGENQGSTFLHNLDYSDPV